MANETYYHPYVPYKVQVELMDAIYETVDRGYKIGLFESPTGTGKTLSIICSTLTWLRRNKRSVDAPDESDDEPEWVRDAYKTKVVARQEAALREYEAHLEQLKRDKLESPLLEVKIHKKRRVEKSAPTEDFVPEDYHENRGEDLLREVHKDVNALMSKLEPKKREERACSNKIKVMISSRTHSQLSQFTGQLKMPKLPSSISGCDEHVKALPLGSRKQSCINPEVARLKDSTAITEACLDLQKAEKGCPFYPKQNDGNAEQLVERFRDLAFSEIRDIEELHDLGERIGVCPYYSARSAIETAEVVMLPYQLLLQDSTRDSLKLSVKDSIVVIDEAHNLFDTISAMNSAEISYPEILDAKKCLKFYLDRFDKRLNVGNRVNLARLHRFLGHLSDFIARTVKELKKIPLGLEVNTVDIFDGTTGDTINFNALVQYVGKTKIAYKIDSYMEHVTGAKSESHEPILFKVRQFMSCMANPSNSGKMFFDKNSKGDACLKYLLLDPSEALRAVVEESRSVILTGGTMEPMEEFTDVLFPYVPRDKIKRFSCDHITSGENIGVFPIGKSIMGNTLEFSFDKRNGMATDLGETVVELLRYIPMGVVAFFPSYAYLEHTVTQWKATGLWTRIEKVKAIVKEEASSEHALSCYSAHITKGRGALLLAVVGGRLSEGINFSDDLARGVIMVGLPFPNLMSGNMIAKRKYIEKRAIERGASRSAATAKARDYYENLCMKQVNQSVGRAIRHINDYACIYLLDQRYESERIKSKLSHWIRKQFPSGSNDVAEVIEATSRFFSCK